MRISVARLQMTLFLPWKRVIMIKKYSVAWQASGWLSDEYSRARSDFAFHRPCCLLGSLGFGSLLHPSFEEKEGADLQSMQKPASCFQGDTPLII